MKFRFSLLLASLLAVDAASAQQPSTVGTLLVAHGGGATKVKVRKRVTAALDDAPELARVLAARAKAIATDPGKQALFLIGHGPNSSEDHARWMENLREVADAVRKATGFRDVKVGLVRDDAPAAVRLEAVRGIRETMLLQNAWTKEPVVVVPILVSSGSVSNTKIPGDLAELPVQYLSVPLLPHPEIARWIEARVASADSLGVSSPAVRAHVH